MVQTEGRLSQNSEAVMQGLFKRMHWQFTRNDHSDRIAFIGQHCRQYRTREGIWNIREHWCRARNSKDRIHGVTLAIGKSCATQSQVSE